MTEQTDPGAVGDRTVGDRTEGDRTEGDRTRGESPQAVRADSWTKKRREKIAAEIARNRRGEFRVPTWVLATLLIVIVGAWIVLILVT